MGVSVGETQPPDARKVVQESAAPGFEETSPGTVCIRVEESLDASSVDALAEHLSGMRELILDFFHAPRCSDAILGYLFERLSVQASTLRLKGLSPHQERLLHYLDPTGQSLPQDRPSNEDSEEADFSGSAFEWRRY